MYTYIHYVTCVCVCDCVYVTRRILISIIQVCSSFEKPYPKKEWADRQAFQAFTNMVQHSGCKVITIAIKRACVGRACRRIDSITRSTAPSKEFSRLYHACGCKCTCMPA